VHARILVIDKDRGLEMAVRALGGSYSAIRIGEATGFNPFQTETDERGAAWLTDWLGDILAGSRPFETAQTVSLNAAVRQIVSADPRLRTFDGLATLVASTDDEGDLVGRVREWGQGGRHGWLFGPGATSQISLSEDVVGIDMCNFIKILDKQSSEWSRDNAGNLMTNWLSTGEVPDVVFANHDDSAIGAILALKAANVPMEDVVVVGVDATADALQFMQAGDLDVTVFQNAKAQGGGGVDVALKLAKGEPVDRVTYIPFELVTPANMADYLGKN